MKTRRRGKYLAAVIPAIFAAACDVAYPSPDLEPASRPACTAAYDPVPWALKAQDLQLGAGMERAPHPVKLASACDAALRDPDADALRISPEELAKLRDEDVSWRAADGSRYEAMLVLPDGTAYGRKGAAAAARVNPSEANAFGAWEGDLPSEAAIQAGIDELERTERASAAAVRDPSNPFADPKNLAQGILGDSLSDDRRVRITNTSTLQSYPYRTIGSINGTSSAGFTNCTASKVGPRHAITAAHCVLSSGGTWTTSGWFHPGQTNNSHPNTGGTAVAWSGVYARDWRVAGRFDYALIYLQDRQDSASLGWLGVYWWNSASGYDGKTAYLNGYPQKVGVSDVSRCWASPLPSNDCDGWMYYDVDVLDGDAYRDDGTLEYDIDTGPSQSGSAVRNGNNVLAVHFGCAAFGGCSSSSQPRNQGSRFRQSMWDDVCGWIGEVDSAYGSHALCP